MPSRPTVYRVLVRAGLVVADDIVGGVFLADGTECKVLTGIDDHSRFVVCCQVVARATGRAVSTAFAHALRRYGGA